MNKLTLMMAVFLVSGMLQSSVVKADLIREGKWSVNSVSKMEGDMPPGYDEAMKKMQNMTPEMKAMMEKNGVHMNMDAQGMTTTSTYTQCITSQDPIPKGKNPNDCQETHQLNGNTFNYHVNCSNNGKVVEGDGYVTYSGDTMESEAKMKANFNGKEMNISVHSNGQYVGLCS